MTEVSAATDGGRSSHPRPSRFLDSGGTPTRFGVIVAIAAATFVLLIYSNIAELLPRLAMIGPTTARLVIYSAFAVGAVATVVYALLRSPPQSLWARLLVAYTGAVAGLLALQAGLSGEVGGLATKSFIAGILQIVGFGFLLGLRPARFAVNGSIVLVLVVTVVLCAADVVFGLFTQIPGRGAGFYFNPNLAALALVLGGLGIIQALPPSARLPMAAFLAFGLSATLSRSGLLIALFVVLACTVPIYADFRQHRTAYRVGAWVGAAVLVVGFAYLVFAYFTPSAFSSKVAWAQQHVIGSPIVDARKFATERAAEGGPAVAGMSDRTSIDCSSWKVVLQGLHRAQSCPWLDPQFIDRQEYFNSGAARTIFALRGLAAFLDAPWLGSGLDSAFKLAPHNTYLLFGVAYGVLGLLFVPAFCLFISLRMGARNGLPVIVFVLVAGAFSHDIFLSRDLVAGLAIALSVGDRAWKI